MIPSMKYEIKKLFKIKGKHYNDYMPCGLNIWQKLWWRFVPGVVIKVRWPVGPLIVDHNDPRWVDLGGAVWVQIDSADPNDHYRPTLEQLVGKQGRDWNWGLADNDVAENQLTIKIRRKYANHATMLALRWS